MCPIKSKIYDFGPKNEIGWNFWSNNSTEKKIVHGLKN